MQKIRCGSRGFILMDALLGMIILTVAVLAIGGLYFQSSRAYVFADNDTVAYNWAQQRMEDLKADPAWRAAFVNSNGNTIPNDNLFNANPPRPGFTIATVPVLGGINKSDIDGLTPYIDSHIDQGDMLTNINMHLIGVKVTVKWHENGIERSVYLWTLYDYYAN